MYGPSILDFGGVISVELGIFALVKFLVMKFQFSTAPVWNLVPVSSYCFGGWYGGDALLHSQSYPAAGDSPAVGVRLSFVGRLSKGDWLAPWLFFRRIYFILVMFLIGFHSCNLIHMSAFNYGPSAMKLFSRLSQSDRYRLHKKMIPE